MYTAGIYNVMYRVPPPSLGSWDQFPNLRAHEDGLTWQKIRNDADQTAINLREKKEGILLRAITWDRRFLSPLSLTFPLGFISQEKIIGVR